MAAQPFKLNLLGSFRLLAADGERVEITSKKGVALIAMLAMADEGERTRSWLYDKLWGSRQQPQARNSLRRELSNLRKSLNKGPIPLLICKHDRVALNLRHFEIDARDDDAVPAAKPRLISGEFLEGLDIAEEDGFEEWLREQRSSLHERASRPKPQQSEPTQIAGADAHAADAPAIGSPDTSRLRPVFDDDVALAVLPFANLTGEPGNDYLSELISEELINHLSRLRWLPVIARNSSFSFAAESSDRTTVGQNLKAKYLLEGRVRSLRDAFWITAALSEAASGHTLWSQRLELPSRYSRDALEQLVTELVAVLDSRIGHAEQMRARSKSHDSLNINDLIWRGRWHQSRLTRPDADVAQEFFAKALAVDPHSPEALIQATFNLGWSIWAGRQSKERIVEMRKLAQHAMFADPDDGRGYMLGGIAEMWLRHPLRARTLLQQAIALNPSLALAHTQLGSSYTLAGEPAKAISHLKTALRLNANDVHLFYTLGELAMAFSMLGMWTEALEHANQALIRRPAYWFAHVIKINALNRCGESTAAFVALQELLAIKPDFSTQYFEWLPFVDRTWVDYLAEGLMTVADHRLDLSGKEPTGPLGVSRGRRF